MPFHDLTDVEQIAMDAWSRGSSDSTQALIAVRAAISCLPTQDAYDAAVRAIDKHRERADKAESELSDLRDRAVAVAEEYERVGRPIDSGAVASMLREWAGIYR